MHTTLRSFARFGLLAAIGLGMALLWVAVAALLSASDARASDRAEDGLLGGVSKAVGELTEPVVEKVVEPVAEKVVAPVADKVAKPAAEKAAEPVTKVAKPVTDKVVKPVTDKVVAPVVTPVTDAVKPVTDAVKTVADAVVEPVVEAVAPITDGVVTPVVEAVLPPVVDAVSPVTDPVVDAVAPVIPDHPLSPVEVPGSNVLPGVPAPSAPAESEGEPIPAEAAVDTQVVPLPTRSSAAPDSLREHTSARIATLFSEAVAQAPAADAATAAQHPLVLTDPVVPAPSAPASEPGSLTSTSAGGAAGLIALLPFGIPFAHRAWARRGRPTDEQGLPAPFFDTDVSPD